MSSEDIEGVASLLRTENINILKRLCESSLLTRDEFIMACSIDNLNVLKHGFVLELIDLCNKYFGGFDAGENKTILDCLLKCVVCDSFNLRTRGMGATNAEMCCSLLINSGAVLPHGRYIGHMSANIFFEYVSRHELLLDGEMFFNIMQTPYCDEKISDWVIEKMGDGKYHSIGGHL